MKSLIILIPALLLLFVVSCSKNNSSSKPQISIKSINTLIPAGGSLNAIIDFKSNSGNLGRGTFLAIRNRLNQIPLPPGTSSGDTVRGPIPDFPDQNKGEFQFNIGWAEFLHQSDAENDTIVLKFAAIDRSGKSSDTIVSPKIVILYQ